MESDPRIFLCQGPPICRLQGDEAVARMQEGCPLCRIEMYDAVTDRWEILQEPRHA